MAHDDEHGQHERIFTLSEANRLIPQLNSNLTSIQQAKAVLSRTKEDIKKASAQAEYGGGRNGGHLLILWLQTDKNKHHDNHGNRILVKQKESRVCSFSPPHCDP